MNPTRHGSVVELKPEMAAEYKRLHAAVWPGVLRLLTAAHIHNYSIFCRQLPDGRLYLFSYFEYTGTDFAGDMARLAAEPVTQQWWQVCKPCHTPLPDRAEGEWWAGMEEVFHLD
jgi:L-rhamnose mutarotase